MNDTDKDRKVRHQILGAAFGLVLWGVFLGVLTSLDREERKGK